MREPLKTVLEKLGVDYELAAYETCPWLHYDEEQGITCSAEVRMGPGAQDMEAEIQFFFDEIDPDASKDDEAQGDGSSGGGSGGGSDRASFAALMDEADDAQKSTFLKAAKRKKPQPSADGVEQKMIMRLKPYSDGHWSAKKLLVKGEDYENKIADWGEKGCNLFRACTDALRMGEIPDIEDLIEKELADGMWGSGGRGRIGRKSPKVNPAALLGMGKKP